MRVVFSIGGSILAPDEVDASYVGEVAALLDGLSSDHELGVVVGGGKPARRRIAEARVGGASWAECDWVGISATRENARALLDALKSAAHDGIPESIHEAASLFGDKIIVLGGTEPGHSTDAVAALLADWVKADLFVNASNVDAVYDKNPREHADAKPFIEVNIRDLIEIVGRESMHAGGYPLLDLTAAKVIQRSQIKTVLLDGRDLENMGAAVQGRPFNGTTVVF